MSEISKDEELPVLISIEIEPGEISFDPAVNEYTIQLDEGIDRMLVRAKTQDASVRYTVSGTNLSPGYNEIVITAMDTDGMQNRYYLHVMVGKAEEIQKTEDVQNGEMVETETSASVIEIIQTESQTSLTGNAPTGSPSYIVIGLSGCAILALLLWGILAVKRFKIKREKQRRLEQRRIARQEREKRFEMARMQQEELLRQIDELTKKSRNATETASGLRIIQLEDESEDYDDSQFEDYYEEDDDDN